MRIPLRKHFVETKKIALRVSRRAFSVLKDFSRLHQRHSVDGAHKGVDFALRCCPAGAESNDVAAVFCFGVVFEDERFAETGLLHWRQDDKLLVGGAAVVHRQAARLKGAADLQGEGVGVLAETVVFAVAKEGDEL